MIKEDEELFESTKIREFDTLFPSEAATISNSDKIRKMCTPNFNSKKLISDLENAPKSSNKPEHAKPEQNNIDSSIYSDINELVSFWKI